MYFGDFLLVLVILVFVVSVGFSGYCCLVVLDWIVFCSGLIVFVLIWACSCEVVVCVYVLLWCSFRISGVSPVLFYV